MAKDSAAKIQSIIGGCRRSGRWRVPAETGMLTLFGRAFIDLRNAETAAEELQFTCLSVFANVTIVVPDGAEVRPSGMAVLGSQRSFVPISDTPCELPVLSVDAITVFGKLHIITGDQLGQPTWRDRRRARKEAKAPTPAEPTADDPPDGDTDSDDDGLVDLPAPRRETMPFAAPADPIEPMDPIDFEARDGSIDPYLEAPVDWSPEGPPVGASNPATLDEALPDTNGLEPSDIAPELSDSEANG